MGKKVLISILYLYFALNIFGQIEEPAIIWNTFNSGKLYNLRGSGGTSNSFEEGNTSVNNFNGNLAIAHSSQIILNNNLGGLLSLNYNANTGHMIFRARPKEANCEVNAPCWILGFKDFAIQTFNFENNYYIHKQGTGTTPNDLGYIWTETATTGLVGNQVPLLIPGYHYTNYERKFEYNNTLAGVDDLNQRHYDLIYLLTADGSLITLYNPNEGERDKRGGDVENTKVGTYLEYGNDKTGYAVVSWCDQTNGNGWQNNGKYGLRTIDFKPGDGLTYRFVEEYVNYERNDAYWIDFWGVDWPFKNRPRICYLKEILSSQGDKLILDYDYSAFGHDPDNNPLDLGRKFFKTLKYVDNLGTQTLLFENQYLKVTTGFEVPTHFQVHLSNNTTNEVFDLWLEGYGMDYNSSLTSVSRSEDPNKTKLFNLVKISGPTTSTNYTYLETPIKRKYKFDKQTLNGVVYHWFTLEYPVYQLSCKKYLKKSEEFYYCGYLLNDYSPLDPDYDTQLGYSERDNSVFTVYRHYHDVHMKNTGRDSYTTTMIKRVANRVVDLGVGVNPISVSETIYSYSWVGGNYILSLPYYVPHGTYRPDAYKYDSLKTEVITTNSISTQINGPNTITNNYYYKMVNIYHHDMEPLDLVDKRIFLTMVETTNGLDSYKKSKYIVTDLGEYWQQGNNAYGYYGGALQKTSEYDYINDHLGGVKKTYNYDFDDFSIGCVDWNGPTSVTKKIMNRQEVRTEGFYHTGLAGGFIGDKSDIKTYSYLNFIPDATQIVDKYFNYQINNISCEKVINTTGGIISDIETTYYGNTQTSKGKILRTIIHNNTGAIGARQADYTYEYYLTGQFQGYLHKKIKSDGSFEEYFYNNNANNNIACKVVDKNKTLTQNSLLFNNTFQMLPYKTTINYNNTIQNLYTKYDGFGNVTYKIDENSYLSKYIYDHKGRLLQSYEPGSFPPNNSDPAFDSESGVLSLSYNDVLWIPEITMKQNMDILQTPSKSVISKQSFLPSATVSSEIKNSQGTFYRKNLVVYNYLGLKISLLDGIGRGIFYNYNGLLQPIKTKYGSATNHPFSEISYGLSPYYINPPAPIDPNSITFKDEMGKEIIEYRDMYGNLVRKISDPSGINAVTNFTYNSLNQLVNITSPEGKVTTYEYDDFGNVSKRTTPDDITNEFKYDKWGNLRFKKHISAPTGSPLLYFNTYDPLGRNVIQGAVKPMDYDFNTLLPDVSQSFENYTTGVNNFLVVNLYDIATGTGVFSSTYGFTTPPGLTNLIVNTEWNIKTRLFARAFRNQIGEVWNYELFNYDQLGNVKENWIKYENKSWKKVVSEYDLMSHLTKQTVCQYIGNSLTPLAYIWYEYDTEGRLWKVYTNIVNNVATKKLEAKYTYNLDDSIEKVYLGPTSSEVVDYTYDSDRGWVNNINRKFGTSTKFNEKLTYYNNGNINTSIMLNLGSSTWATLYDSYTYDGMNRLINTSRESFTYNKDGAFLTKGIGSNDIYTYEYVTYQNGLQSNRLQSVKNNSTNYIYNFQYDYKGNVISDGVSGISYMTYDRNNNLLTSGLSSDGSANTIYQYNSENNRIVKKNTSGGGGEFYLQDHTGRTLGVFDLTTDKIKFINIYGNGLIGRSTIIR
ncbi:MAG: hypothetical protein V1773_01845 [bacterium]